MGRLNNGEIADLNGVLSRVGDVTKIVTLIDNIDPSNPTPTVQTPVAVDSNTVSPSTATATPYTDQ